MQTVLIVIHLMVVTLLVVVVLLQRSEGGVLGQGGGGFMTGRGQANAMTRATGILAALFFATSLALTILANYSRAPKTIFEGQAPGAGTSAPVSAPVDPTNPLDALKQMELQKQRQTAPVPAAPVPAPEAPKP